jgi:hypothetical protein
VNQRRDWFTPPQAKCVDAFDSSLLRCVLARHPGGRGPNKRGPKRVHFVECVTLAAFMLRNMLYRGGCGTRWHVGCNYLFTRETSSGIQKKEDTGLQAFGGKVIAPDTGYG